MINKIGWAIVLFYSREFDLWEGFFSIIISSINGEFTWSMVFSMLYSLSFRFLLLCFCDFSVCLCRLSDSSLLRMVFLKPSRASCWLKVSFRGLSLPPIFSLLCASGLFVDSSTSSNTGVLPFRGFWSSVGGLSFCYSIFLRMRDILWCILATFSSKTTNLLFDYSRSSVSCSFYPGICRSISPRTYYGTCRPNWPLATSGRGSPRVAWYSSLEGCGLPPEFMDLFLPRSPRI